MAERSNAAVSKTVSGFVVRRGFKSPSLRFLSLLMSGISGSSAPRGSSAQNRSWEVPTATRLQQQLVELGQPGGRVGGLEVGVEHHHRHRAQIEERIKDHKLGVSLRHLPASDLGANRT